MARGQQEKEDPKGKSNAKRTRSSERLKDIAEQEQGAPAKGKREVQCTRWAQAKEKEGR